MHGEESDRSSNFAPEFANLALRECACKSPVLAIRSDPTVAEGNKAYREEFDKLKTKALLPVVECRMTNVVIGKKGTGPSINFHLIFDPTLSLDDIERFIKNLQVKGQSIGTRCAEAASRLIRKSQRQP